VWPTSSGIPASTGAVSVPLAAPLCSQSWALAFYTPASAAAATPVGLARQDDRCTVGSREVHVRVYWRVRSGYTVIKEPGAGGTRDGTMDVIGAVSVGGAGIAMAGR
jgi:hypothetical protein